MKPPSHLETKMGPALQAEVERQLRRDLEHYLRSASTRRCSIDWSEACGEGHCTNVLGGVLENASALEVLDAEGNPLAGGWVDFVHGGGAMPLHVFWLFLDVGENSREQRVTTDNAIPEHVWSAMTDASKDACVVSEVYDSRWSNDPKVRAWRQARRLR